MNTSCTLKVCDQHEVIELCVEKFDTKHRMIKLDRAGKSKIPLTPVMFRRRLKLPNPMKISKVSNVGAFLNACNGGVGTRNLT